MNATTTPPVPPPAGKTKSAAKPVRKIPAHRSKLLARYLAAPHVFWAALFIIAPMIFIVYYAFTNGDGAFTLSKIIELANREYVMIFLRSGGLALAATAICLVIAYPIAYFISRAKAKNQRLLIMLVMLPMWINFIIRTYAIMSIIENNGIIDSILTSISGLFGGGTVNVGFINTPGAMIFGMVYDFLPYMILPIYSVMTKIDKRLIEASHDLGAGSAKTLTKVIMPLSVSGIVSGILMVFVPSISTFYISEKLGGGNYKMIGDTIEEKFLGQGADKNLGAALALVLMILIIISTTVLGHFTDEENGGGLVA